MTHSAALGHLLQAFSQISQFLGDSWNWMSQTLQGLIPGSDPLTMELLSVGFIIMGLVVMAKHVARTILGAMIIAIGVVLAIISLGGLDLTGRFGLP